MFESLACANLGQHEWRLLMTLIRKIMGWHRVADWISLGQFEKATQIPRRNCLRALQRLIFRRVIVVSRENRFKPKYAINKKIEEWDLFSVGRTPRVQSMASVSRENRVNSDGRTPPLSQGTTAVYSVGTLTKERPKEKEKKDRRKGARERAATSIIHESNSNQKSQKREAQRNLQPLANQHTRMGASGLYTSEEWATILGMKLPELILFHHNRIVTFVCIFVS